MFCNSSDRCRLKENMINIEEKTEKEERLPLGAFFVMLWFFVISALLDEKLSKQYLVEQVYVLVAVEVELVSGFF